MVKKPRKTPRWVPRLVLDTAHTEQLREHGGLLGIRDENALEAALARPQQKWHYDPDADFASLAAAYAYGIARAHPYNDGNKRTAFLSAVIFLGINDKEFDATEVEVVETMLALADGSLSEDALAKWIRDRIFTGK